MVYLSSHANWQRPALHWANGQVHPTRPLACPHCGHVHDGHRSHQFAGDEAPQPGSVSLCADCWEFATFDLDAQGELSLRAPTVDEIARIKKDARLMRSRAQVKYGLE